MKKLIFILAVITTILLASCKSNSEKQDEALEDVVEVNEDLNKVDQTISKDRITKANVVE